MERQTGGEVFTIAGNRIEPIQGSSYLLTGERGERELRVERPIHLVAADAAEVTRGGRTIALIETADPAGYIKAHGEELKETVGESRSDENGRREYVGVAVLTPGGMNKEKSDEDMRVTITVEGHSEGGFSYVGNPPGAYKGLWDASIVVARSHGDINTFTKRCLPENLPEINYEHRREMAALIFVVPLGSEALLKDTLRLSGLSPEVGLVNIGHQILSAGQTPEKNLSTITSTRSQLEQQDKRLGDEIGQKRREKWERIMFEIPRPDNRKVDLGWRENPLIEAGQLAKSVLGLIREKKVDKGELAIKAALVARATKAMRTCPFTPRGIGWKESDALPNRFISVLHWKGKLAALDILQEIWDKSPDVIRDYIQAASTFASLPHQPNHIKEVWKEAIEARMDVRAYQEYLDSQNRKLDEFQDPDLIDSLVFAAFPEMQTLFTGVRHEANLLQLKRSVGEKDTQTLLAEDHEKIILERAKKMFPKDKEIKEELTRLGWHI